MNRLLLPVLALSALVLAGCNTTQQGVPFAQPLVAPAVPRPGPLVLDDFRVRVYTKEQLRKLVADADKSGQQITLFALTPQGYQQLSMNMIELERYIREQKVIIAFLEKTLADRGVKLVPADPSKQIPQTK